MSVCVNAAELLTKSANETSPPRHVTNTTSSLATPTSDDIIASPLRHRHEAFPPYYGDVNIPTDSYFTGDEEIPIWNVRDHVPLLYTATAAAADDDDDDDRPTTTTRPTATTTTTTTTTTGSSSSSSSSNGASSVDEKLLELGRLILSQLSSSYVSPAANDDSTAVTDRTRDVIVSPHKPMTSSATAAAARYHDDGETTTTTTTTRPTTTTDSAWPFLGDDNNTTASPVSRRATTTYSVTSPSDHVTDGRRDVTTMTSSGVQELGNYSSWTTKSGVLTTTQTAIAAAAAGRMRHQQTARTSGAGRASRPQVAPGRGRGRLGGFGPWGGSTSRQGGLDYFDFFDYVVDYRTPRPPITSPRRPTHTRRPHMQRRKSGRVRSGRGQYVKSGRVRGHGPGGANVIYTWPPSDGAERQVDVVGQSEYRLEVTDAAGGTGSVGQRARGSGGSRRGRPALGRQLYGVEDSGNLAGSSLGPRRTRGRGGPQTTRGRTGCGRLGLKQSVYGGGSEEHLAAAGSLPRRTRGRGGSQTARGRTQRRRLTARAGV